MIARGASVLLALMLAASCGANGRAAASPSHTTTTVASPSATPLIDVNDMMGAFPPATFFVATKDGVKAIALLNHATRYTIPVGEDAQVAAAGPAGRVYVLDRLSEGARLRWFDIDSGTERASRVLADAVPARTGIGHGGLTIDDKTGLVYALLTDKTGIRADAFDWFTLRPGRSLGGMTCGERLAAAAGRLVVACLTTGAISAESTVGSIVVDDGGPSFKLRASFAINSIAMLGDGTLMVGGGDGSLMRMGRNQDVLISVGTLKEYGKGLIPDGIAANGDCCFYYGVIDSTANDVQPRVIAGGTALIVFPSVGVPTGGLFVQAPFAYYVIGGRARHTDINQGFSEVMADLGPSALPGAVSNR